MCLPEKSNESVGICFGVLVGPSSSGKTTAVREVCSNNPEGILYYEISEPSTFVAGLSKEIGMKTLPKSVLDIMLGYLLSRYQYYHVLPDEQLPWLDMVLQVLTCTASSYMRAYGKIPMLFIDGVNLLVKRDQDLCGALIALAKILANGDKIKLVFVSSEGTVIPFLQQLSARNRVVAILFVCIIHRTATSTSYLSVLNVTKILSLNAINNPWKEDKFPFINSKVYLNDVAMPMAVKEPQVVKVVTEPEDARKQCLFQSC